MANVYVLRTPKVGDTKIKSGVAAIELHNGDLINLDLVKMIYCKKDEEDNDILETSLDRITSIEAENIELRRELEKLKEELNIEHNLSDYEYLNATVVSRNVGFWYNSFSIFYILL